MKKKVAGFAMFLMLAAFLSGCATNMGRAKKETIATSSSKNGMQESSGRMVAIDTEEHFKEKIFNTLALVEFYEQDKVIELSESSLEDLFIKRYLLNEIVYHLSNMRENQSIMVGFRTLDVRIMPYMRTLPYYQQEFKRVNELIIEKENAQEEKIQVKKEKKKGKKKS